MIICRQQTTSSKLTDEWKNLEEKLRQRDDYKTKICFHREKTNFYLFGLTDLVKEFRQLFEEILENYEPKECKIKLSPTQVNC